MEQAVELQEDRHIDDGSSKSILEGFFVFFYSEKDPYWVFFALSSSLQSSVSQSINPLFHPLTYAFINVSAC